MKRRLIIITFVFGLMLPAPASIAGLDEIGQTMFALVHQLVKLAVRGDLPIDRYRDGSVDIVLAEGVVLTLDANATEDFDLD